MKVTADGLQHLTYCLNVHPGETWADNLEAIRTHVLPLRDRIAPGQPFGLGLRLSHAASLELVPESHSVPLKALAPPSRAGFTEAETLPAVKTGLFPPEATPKTDTLAAFRTFLAENDLYVVTINAFPYGAFHGERVKKAVYQPDWRTDERRDYTIRAADIAAALAAPGETISISTVPGSYGAWITTEADVARMVERLMDVVAHLASLERTSGVRITLGLEPEPDCFLQTTADVIAFFAGPIRDLGAPHLAKLLNCNALSSQDLIRRHLGICFDTCHLALQFEALDESLHRIAEAGILISKVQISSALSTSNTPAARAALGAFLDPVYLHQVKIRSRGSSELASHPDLEAALNATAVHPDETWRVHFHVPLYFETYGALSSTATDLTPAFFKALDELKVPHLEIETYTFNVLPPELRTLGIGESLAKEQRWVMERLFMRS